MENVTLIALRKEKAARQRAKDRIQKEFDERDNIHLELLAINKEFAELAKGKEPIDEQLKKIKILKARSEKAEKIRKKDFMKLLNRLHEAEFALDRACSELAMEEFRDDLRNRRS